MSNVLPFIPKADYNTPDHYTMMVWFHDGKGPLEVEIAQHRILDKVMSDNGRDAIGPHAAPTLEYVTKDDVWGLIPVSSIKRLEFDKRFSQIIAMRQKELAEKNQAALDAFTKAQNDSKSD